jgi:hypothetical protein
MRSAGGIAGADEEQLSMSAAELNEFLTAMDIVRRANAALLDVTHDSGVEDDDINDSRRLAGLSTSPTIH